MSLRGVRGRLTWGVGPKQGEGMSLQESGPSQQGEEGKVRKLPWPGVLASRQVRGLSI